MVNETILLIICGDNTFNIAKYSGRYQRNVKNSPIHLYVAPILLSRDLEKTWTLTQTPPWSALKMTWTNARYPRNCIFTNIWTMIIHGPRCELQRWFELSNPWETTLKVVPFSIRQFFVTVVLNSFKLLAKNTHTQTKNKTTLFNSIHDEHTQIIPLTVNWLYKFTQSLVRELPYSTIMPEERSKSELSSSKNVKYTIYTYPANPTISKHPSWNGFGWNTYFCLSTKWFILNTFQGTTVCVLNSGLWLTGDIHETSRNPSEMGLLFDHRTGFRIGKGLDVVLRNSRGIHQKLSWLYWDVPGS